MNLTFKSRFTFLLTIQLLNISSRAQGAESRGRTKYLDGPERLAGLPAAPHLLLVALGRLPVTDALPLRDEDARQPSSLFLLLLLGSSVPAPREPSNSADLSQSGGEATVRKENRSTEEANNKKNDAHNASPNQHLGYLLFPKIYFSLL